METQEKYTQVINAFQVMERDINEYSPRMVYRDDIAQEVENAMLEIQNNMDAGFDLSYGIMSDACDALSDIGFETLQDEDKASDTIYEQERASVYTSARLAYLTSTNEDEISDMVKEHCTTISEACAYWYNEKVQEAAHALRDYIISDSNSTN